MKGSRVAAKSNLYIVGVTIASLDKVTFTFFLGSFFYLSKNRMRLLCEAMNVHGVEQCWHISRNEQFD